MLRKLHDVAGFDCEASDGSIGPVEDVCFDDRTWPVRVLIVAAGPWLAGRKVPALARRRNERTSPSGANPNPWREQTVHGQSVTV